MVSLRYSTVLSIHFPQILPTFFPVSLEFLLGSYQNVFFSVRSKIPLSSYLVSSKFLLVFFSSSFFKFFRVDLAIKFQHSWILIRFYIAHSQDLSSSRKNSVKIQFHIYRSCSMMLPSVFPDPSKILVPHMGPS